MAKEDFCFTYYDGDAARDMAHMNRLERGAYSDFIVSQRKFGHLSLLLIKKTFGNDFDIVWESIEIILKKDGEGKFFIEWLENSIIKMKKQSVHQSENGKKGGRPKADKNPNDNPNKTQTESHENPLENGDGYVNELEDVFKNENSQKLLVPEMFLVFKKSLPNYPGDREKDFEPLLSIANFIINQLGLPGGPIKNRDCVMAGWEQITEWIAADNFYNSKPLKTISAQIQEIYQKKIKSNGINGTIVTQTPKPGQLSAAIREIEKGLKNK